jgi:hypothetical protein
MRNVERARAVLLADSPMMRSLRVLEDADLRDEDLRELVGALDENTHVQELVLRGARQVTQNGIAAMLDATRNTSLIRLVLPAASEAAIDPRARKVLPDNRTALFAGPPSCVFYCG